MTFDGSTTDCVQVIVSGMPLIQGAGASLQLRFTKDSRRPWLANPRGLYDASVTYYLNDEVCSGTTFWRSIDATPFSGVTPVEGSNWTKSDKFEWANADPTKVFVLQTIGGYDGNIKGFGPSGLLVNVPGALARYDAKDEGKLSPDRREITLRDGITITGVDGSGTPVSYDFSTGTYKSFLGWLFGNTDALTTWNWNRILSASTYDDVTAFECYWMGESKNFANLGADSANLAGRTANARQAGSKHVTIEGGINRFETITTSDIFPLVALPVEGIGTDTKKYPGADFTDPFGLHGAVQFVGGIIADQGSQTTDYTQGNLFKTPTIINTIGLDFEWQGMNAPIGSGANLGAVIACVTSNYGLHFMTLDKMFSKFATRTQTEWDSTKCSSPVGLWSDYCNSNAIVTKRIDGGNPFTTSGFCFEAVFGSDPRCNQGVSEITTPVSLGWGTPLSDSLVRYAKQLFCKLSFPINQTTKQQELLLTSLNYLNTVSYNPGSYLVSSYVAGAGSFTVSSGFAFLANATLAIGQNAATFLAGGGSIFTQLQYQGIAQTIAVTGVAGNVVSYTAKDTELSWPSFTAVNPVQLLPSAWKDGAKTQSEPATISAKHVQISVKGDNDAVTCPNSHGDSLPIEIAHNVRRLGNLGAGTVGINDVTYNTGVALNQQRNGWRPLIGGSAGFGEYCVMRSAVILSNTSGDPDTQNYRIHHAAIDARAFRTSITHSPGNTDICVWRDTVTGITGWAYITSQFSHKEFEIGIPVNSDSPSPNFPVVGHATDFLVGCTTGFYNGRTDGGWLFDVTVGVTFGVALDGSTTLLTKSRLDGNDVYPTNGGTITGQRPFQFQNIILPAYGVFTMQNIVWDAVNSQSVITIDRSIPYANLGTSATGTDVEARIGMPEIASDGWAFAAYLYYMNSADERFGADWYGSTPAKVDDFTNHLWVGLRNQFISDPDNFTGAYTLSRLTVGLPEGATDVGAIAPPSDAYGVAHYATAQAYARRFIGLFHNATRTNNGVLGNDGGLTSWGNGDSFVEQRDGAVRCYVMEGHEMNEAWKGDMSIRAREWPDLSLPLTARRYPVIINGGANTSGGAGGGGGIGGGGGSPSAGTLVANFTITISASTNDLNFGAPSQFTWVNVNVTAAWNLTGIVGGADGYEVTLYNTGTGHLSLLSDNASSTAANRFHFPGGSTLTIGPAQAVTLHYVGALSRWVFRSRTV